MLKDEVLALLKESAGEVSGQAMSERLGVSRAAVWKAMEALRGEGYTISSAPSRGYRLEDSPDRLSPGELAGALRGRTLGGEIVCLDSVDSTNDECARRALAGAGEGLLVLADTQTGGKGRRGRSFESPAGEGLYLSVLLRPKCSLRELMWFTAWTAVAVCDGVEAACGIRPGIKWTNDLVLKGRKLCGILTELGMEGESGALQYAVAGVGINVGQREFGPLAGPVAVSLRQALGRAPRRSEVAAAVLSALDDMYRSFPGEKERYLERYRRDCLTLGRRVRVLGPDGEEEGFAEGIDEEFGLIVRYDDGRIRSVTSGEVSVRGLFGYAE